MKGEDTAAVAVFGDGATNIGAFHEGLNLAQVWRLPVVFLCENNLYGEYSPIASTTAVTELAERARSYAMPSMAVDGQYSDAVAEAIGAALERARDGGGPSFIEAKTYRYAGHSRSDIGAYRPAGELDAWKTRDPIRLLEARLVDDGVLDAAACARLVEETQERVNAAVASAVDQPEPGPFDMFANRA